MPITLGCPSCGKRFRARDESAGKKVKCPYCQAAVQVPTAEESASAGAPTAPLPHPDSTSIPVPAPRPAPPPMPASPRPTAAPTPASVASPDDWGAVPSAPPPPPPASPPAPLELDSPGPGARGKDKDKDRAKSAKGEKEKGEKPAKGKGRPEETPERVLAAGWRSVRRGLFWVQFALLWLALVAFVGFGKAVYTRTGNELPKGDGTSWVSIEGYINSDTPNSVRLSKPELMDLALYGIPVFFASIAIVFGRLRASSAPRSSGARGLFSVSALVGLIGFAGLFGWFIFSALKMKEEEKYTFYAFVLLLPLAEFWFLNGLTASGLALKRPRAARAVGVVGFFFALAAFAATLGWDLYREHGRPKKPDDEIKLFEQAALMLGWLLLVGVYWRAVRNVRVAAQEYLDTVEEPAA